VTASGDLRQLAHRDPTCRAGFSVVLDATVAAGDGWDDRRPTRVHVRCWDCDTWHRLELGTLALDRDEHVEGDLRRAAREQRPYVWGGDWPDSLRTLAGAVPPVQVGRVQLLAEGRTGWGSAIGTDDVYSWWVCDSEGNVLGVVERYHGQRGGRLFRCGLAIGEGLLGEGFRSAAAAARRVQDVALGSREAVAAG
jgi:hypothetical protein